MIDVHVLLSHQHCVKPEDRVSYSKEVTNNSILTVKSQYLTPTRWVKCLLSDSKLSIAEMLQSRQKIEQDPVYLSLHSQGNSFLEKVGHVRSRLLASLDPDTAVAAPRANQTVGCLGHHLHDAHILPQPLDRENNQHN